MTVTTSRDGGGSRPASVRFRRQVLITSWWRGVAGGEAAGRDVLRDQARNSVQPRAFWWRAHMTTCLVAAVLATGTLVVQPPGAEPLRSGFKVGEEIPLLWEY